MCNLNYEDYPCLNTGILRFDRLWLFEMLFHYSSFGTIDWYAKDKINVLDMGCGTCECAVAAALKYKNVTIHCVDVSENILEYGKKLAEKYNVDNIRFYVGSIYTINLPIKFDAVILSGVIHHLKNPLIGINNILKLCTDSCVFAFYIYSLNGRFDVLRIQNALSLLYREKTLSEQISIVRDLINENNKGLRTVLSWKQNHGVLNDCYSDNFLVDMFAPGFEKLFSLPEVFRFLDRANLDFVRFVNETSWDPNLYFNNPELLKEIANLSKNEKYFLVDNLIMSENGYEFIAIKKGNKRKFHKRQPSELGKTIKRCAYGELKYDHNNNAYVKLLFDDSIMYMNQLEATIYKLACEGSTIRKCIIKCKVNNIYYDDEFYETLLRLEKEAVIAVN
ncbi:MAG: class I SAM-dependent methyltransferase [Candidatus Krumholzibacteriota bacterium]|nr:class I SAM-dependent methyltransferase [Candidatus Krumholzibacteriota bacterium]